MVSYRDTGLMTRREFLQLGTWATIAAALRVKEVTTAAATPVPTPQVTGWGMPWKIGWQIGEQPIPRQFLPVVKS